MITEEIYCRNNENFSSTEEISMATANSYSNVLINCMCQLDWVKRYPD